jgi:hypothetical protein
VRRVLLQAVFSSRSVDQPALYGTPGVLYRRSYTGRPLLQGERERRLAAENVSKGIGDYTRDEVSLALVFGTGAAAGGMTAAPSRTATCSRRYVQPYAFGLIGAALSKKIGVFHSSS